MLYSESLPIDERKKFFSDFFKFFRFGSGFEWPVHKDEPLKIDTPLVNPNPPFAFSAAAKKPFPGLEDDDDDDDFESVDVDLTSQASSIKPGVAAAPSWRAEGKLLSSKTTAAKKAPPAQTYATDSEVETDTETATAASVNSEAIAQVAISNNAGFETMKETIYREVAVFIALNESRPNFLVQVFRELQCLTSDYLRHRTLNVLHDLIRSVLPDDTNSTVTESHADTLDQYANEKFEVESQTQSDVSASEGYQHSFDADIAAGIRTDDDDDDDDDSSSIHMEAIERALEEAKQAAKAKSAAAKKAASATNARSSQDVTSQARRTSELFDYVEQVNSVTSVLTPSDAMSLASMSDKSDPLGDTVIHRGNPALLEVFKQMDAAREAATPGSRPTSAVAKSTPTPSSRPASASSRPGTARAAAGPEDATALAHEFHDEIESNKATVIALSKLLSEKTSDSTSAVFNEPVVAEVCQLINSQAAKLSSAPADFLGQLGATIRDSLVKYVGRSISDQSDAILRDVSDILYDEMIFNKVIHQIDQSYEEEISELQTSHSNLTSDIEKLKKQRQEDLEKLQHERWQRLRKGNRSSTSSLPEQTASEAGPESVPANITAAQLSLDQSADEEAEEVDEEIEGDEVTLADLPAKLDIPALEHLTAGNPEDDLTTEPVPPPPTTDGTTLL